MATTKISANVLASGAALTNINAGSTIDFTKNVSMSGNLTVGTTAPVGAVGSTNTINVGNISGDVKIGVYVGGGSATYSCIWMAQATTLNTATAALQGSGIHTFLNAPYTSGNVYIRTFGTDRMIILGANGNVGIGTTTPSERLTVVGNISASGNIYTNNQKVATENFAVAMAIALG